MHIASRDRQAEPRRVALLPDPSLDVHHHESHSRRHIANGVAKLLDTSARPEGEAVPGDYLVASRPLLPHEAIAHSVGGIHDIFGSIVPHAFVGSKVIVHPLATHDSRRPDGWVAGLGGELDAVALRGFSAFARKDAMVAAHRLLDLGPVRLKRADACGGHGQTVVLDMQAFERAIDEIDDADLENVGVVVEENLLRTRTLSVGSLVIGGWSGAYVGTQRQAIDHLGRTVYGGSELRVLRGGLADMLDSGRGAEGLQAIRHVMHFEACVQRAFPSLLASRRNYDVLCGVDAKGEARMGILEQSWRVGGASAAEIAALLAFKEDPSLRAVDAATWETYGSSAIPPSACVYYTDEYGRMGGLRKFVTWSPHGR